MSLKISAKRRVLDACDGMTPQQIYIANVRNKMRAKAEELREIRRTEDAIKAMPKDEKKRLKLRVLYESGYDKSVPVHKQQMKVRILYYLTCEELHKNEWIKEAYAREIGT